MKKIAVLFFICAMLACDESPTQADNDYSNYFPIELNNSWTYSSTTGSTTQTHHIWETRVYDNQVYSLWGSQSTNTVPLLYEEGKIFRIQNNEKMVWLDFTIEDGGTYTYNASDKVNYTVTVTRDIRCECGENTWQNCIEFFFDDASKVNEELTYTLAPDIGIVQISGAWVHLCLSDYNRLY